MTIYNDYGCLFIYYLPSQKKKKNRFIDPNYFTLWALKSTEQMKRRKKNEFLFSARFYLKQFEKKKKLYFTAYNKMDSIVSFKYLLAWM